LARQIHQEADFQEQKTDEEQWLAAYPKPPDRDLYGAWRDGPQRTNTGFFRTAFVLNGQEVNPASAPAKQGRWWLVAPSTDGRRHVERLCVCSLAGGCGSAGNLRPGQRQLAHELGAGAQFRTGGGGGCRQGHLEVRRPQAGRPGSGLRLDWSPPLLPARHSLQY